MASLLQQIARRGNESLYKERPYLQQQEQNTHDCSDGHDNSYILHSHHYHISENTIVPLTRVPNAKRWRLSIRALFQGVVVVFGMWIKVCHRIRFTCFGSFFWQKRLSSNRRGSCQLRKSGILARNIVVWTSKLRRGSV